MRIAVIDNYDSFTYNLVQYLREAAAENTVSVLRNDAFEMGELAIFDALVLSPGPGLPSEAGQLLEVIKQYALTKPILGICLGHQAIAEAFGGTLRQLEMVYHGIATNIQYDKTAYLFKGMPTNFEVGRYHSWVVDSLPDTLEYTATDEEGQIMALKHKTHPVFGLQFHPESILTAQGRKLIDNFLAIV